MKNCKIDNINHKNLFTFFQKQLHISIHSFIST